MYQINYTLHTVWKEIAGGIGELNCFLYRCWSNFWSVKATVKRILLRQDFKKANLEECIE